MKAKKVEFCISSISMFGEERCVFVTAYDMSEAYDSKEVDFRGDMVDNVCHTTFQDESVGVDNYVIKDW